MKRHFVQAAIMCSAISAAWLLTSKSPRARAWGCVTGFIGQPFWLWMSVQSGEWGVFLLSFWYAICYVRGFFTNRKLL